MVILGIDPGFSFTGYSVIKKKDRAIYLIDHGYLSLPQRKHLSARVGIFYSCFSDKIKEYQVTDLALETSFLGKNAQNFLKLGYLRGVLYLLADQYNLALHEFSPREVKQAVTGYGGAAKDQVARVIYQLFPAMTQAKKSDVTDAIAVTLCGLWKHPHLKRDCK